MNAVQRQYEQEPRWKTSTIISMIFAFLFLVWSTTAIDFSNLTESGMKIAKNILLGIVQPNMDLLFNFTQQGVPYLLLETVAIAFLGTIVGSVLAIPLAFLSATTIVPKPVAYLVRLLLIVIRTIPAIIYGLLFIRVTGQGAFTGVLTMSFVSIGMLSKLYTDVIEELDHGVLEAMESAGCTTYEKIRFGVIPQLSALFVSIVIYRFDMNMRDAAVLGLVGAGGIGAPLIFAMNSHRWPEVGALLIGLIILILIIEWMSNRLRSKIIKGV